MLCEERRQIATNLKTSEVPSNVGFPLNNTHATFFWCLSARYLERAVCAFLQ